MYLTTQRKLETNEQQAHLEQQFGRDVPILSFIPAMNWQVSSSERYVWKCSVWDKDEVIMFYLFFWNWKALVMECFLWFPRTTLSQQNNLHSINSNVEMRTFHQKRGSTELGFNKGKSPPHQHT